MKKLFRVNTIVLLLLLFSCALSWMYLYQKVQALPLGERIYENRDGTYYHEIVAYELENDFVILCSYEEGELVTVVVRNDRTKSMGCADAREKNN